MSKTFTLSEAQTLLPVVEALLRKAQTAATQAGELEREMQQLSQRIFLSGGMHVDVSAAARRRAERDKAVQEAKDTLAEIDSIGVQVKDLEQGLLDFVTIPSFIELQFGFTRGDDMHVVLVGFLADAADVGGDDDVVALMGRRHVHGNDDHLGMFRQSFIDELLGSWSGGSGLRRRGGGKK